MKLCVVSFWAVLHSLQAVVGAATNLKALTEHDIAQAIAPVTSTADWPSRLEALDNICQMHTVPHFEPSQLERILFSLTFRLPQGPASILLLYRICSHHLRHGVGPIRSSRSNPSIPQFTNENLKLLLEAMTRPVDHPGAIPDFASHAEPYLIYLIRLLKAHRQLKLPSIHYAHLSLEIRNFLWYEFRKDFGCKEISMWAVDCIEQREKDALQWFRRLTRHSIWNLPPAGIKAYITYVMKSLMVVPIEYGDTDWIFQSYEEALRILLIEVPLVVAEVALTLPSRFQAPSPGESFDSHYLLPDLPLLAYFYSPFPVQIVLNTSPEHQILSFDILLVLTGLHLKPDYRQRSQYIVDHLSNYFPNQPGKLLQHLWEDNRHRVIRSLLSAPQSEFNKKFLETLPWEDMYCQPLSYIVILAETDDFVPPSMSTLDSNLCHEISTCRKLFPRKMASPCIAKSQWTNDLVEIVDVQIPHLLDIDDICMLLRARLYFQFGVPLELTQGLASLDEDQWLPLELVKMANVFLDRYCQLMALGTSRVKMVLQEAEEQVYSYIENHNRLYDGS